MKAFNQVLIILFLLITSSANGDAQALLQRSVSIDAKRQRLDNVLEIISNRGDFFFSYNSRIIKADSLVSIAAVNKPVVSVLKMLFADNFEFRESGNFIIIKPAPIQLTILTNKAVTENKFFAVSGYVMDDQNGHWIANASVYEKTALAATLTNSQGYFKLKLKQKTKAAKLTISKEFYQDTSVAIDPGFDQQLSITLQPASAVMTIIAPEDYFAPDQLKVRVRRADSSLVEYTYVKQDSAVIEKTRAGRLLISSAQKIQDLNLRKFFTSRPYQVSLVPGLGTHGKISGQVSNSFSLNVFGGYNGGVKGFELGGLFNIDRRAVKYVQIGGLLNIDGGMMHGLQIGGINNTVLDAVDGLQIGGISNINKGKLRGFQIGGIYNHVSDSVSGMQLGGIVNFAKDRMSGVQIAGIANISNRQMNGMQLAGIINYAKKVKGVQIGLINISDTSEGLGVGLINIVLKGYHKLSLSSNELIEGNIAFKTGSQKLYNILQAGMNFNDHSETYSFGYGVGSELRLYRSVYLNPELTANQIYMGSWDDLNLAGRLSLHLNLHLGRYVSVYAGPSLNAYYSTDKTQFPDYKPSADYHTFHYTSNVKGWLGWNVGVNFF